MDLPTIEEILKSAGPRIGPRIPVRTREDPYPPETELYPRWNQETFNQAEMARRQEPTFWQTLLNALSSGEYAVSNFLRETIRTFKGTAETDPLSAALEGFKAGFKDDSQYKLRMGDVFTELGWTPPEGSWEATGKGVTAFITGALLDPMNYVLGIGAPLRAARIAGREVAQVAGAMGKQLPGHLTSAWHLSSLGKKVLKGMSEEEVVKLREAMPLGLPGQALTKPTEVLYRAMGEETAKKELLRHLLPNSIFDEKELKLVKNEEAVGRILKHAGLEVTPQNIKEFVEGGYKKLLDPGGLRFFGLRFLAPKGVHFLPNESRVSGFLQGYGTAAQLPLGGSLMAKGLDTGVAEFFRENALKPFTSFLQKVFRTDKALSPMENAVARYLHAASRRGDEEATEMVANLLLVKPGGTKVAEVLGQKLATPEAGEAGFKRITRQQGQVVSRLLLRARSKRIDWGNFKPWAEQTLKNPDEAVRKWFDDLHFKKGLTDDQIGEIVTVADNTQGFLRQISVAEKSWGTLKADQRAYFSKIYRKAETKLDQFLNNDEIGKGWNWWDLEETVAPRWDWDDVANAAKQGDSRAPGILEDDLATILEARINASFQSAYKRSAIQQIQNYVSRFPHRAGVFKSILTNRDFVRRYPELAEMISKGADFDEALGVSARALRTGVEGESAFVSTLNTIDKKLDAQGTKALLLKWLEKGNTLTNLSENNVKALKSLYDGSLQAKQSAIADLTKRLKEAGVPEEQIAQRVAEHQGVANVLKELRPWVFTKIESGRLEESVARVSKELVTKYAKRDLPYAPLQPHQEERLAQLVDGKPTSYAVFTGEELKKAVEAPIRQYQEKLSAPDLDHLQATAVRSANRLSTIQYHQVRLNREWEGAFQGIARGGGTDYEKLAENVRSFDTKIQASAEKVRLRQRAIADSGNAGYRDRAEQEMLQNELQTLMEIQRQAPSESLVRYLKEGGGAEIARVVADIDQIVKLAEQRGVKDYLSGIIDAVSPNKAIEGLSQDHRDFLLNALKRPNPPKAIQEIAERWLVPTATTQNVRPLVTGQTFSVQSPLTGMKYSSDGILAVDPAFAKAVAGSLDWQRSGDWSFLWNQWDRAENFFRRYVTGVLAFGIPRAGFYARNVVDLTWRTFLDHHLGAFKPDPARWRDYMRVVRGLPEELESQGLKGRGLSGAGVLEDLKVGDIFSRSYRAADIRPTGWLNDSLKFIETYSPFHAFTTKQRISEWFEGLPMAKHLGASRLAADVDNFFTVNSYLTKLERGTPYAQALEEMRNTLFYYGGLSKTEKGVFRRIFPFYTFMREAVPFYARVLAKQPGIIGFLPRISDLSNWTPEEESLLPPDIKDYPMIATEKKGKKISLLSFRNVFTVDLGGEIMDLDITKWLSQLNPMITTPIEFVMGKTVYMRRDIKQDKLLSRGLETPFMKATLGKLLNAREVTVRGQKMTAVDGYAYHLLTRLWFGRLYRELDDMSNVIAGNIGEKGLWGLLTGIKFVELDLDRQKTLSQQDSDRALTEYRTALRRGDTVRANGILDALRLPHP